MSTRRSISGGRIYEGSPIESIMTLFAVPELEWQERSLCSQTDPEAFFPEKGASPANAKRVCLSCEVRDDCLAYALDNDERFGVWGGLTRHERDRLAKARNNAT